MIGFWMKLFRQQDRKTRVELGQLQDILLIESSMAMASLLKSQIEAQTNVKIRWAQSLQAAATQLAEYRPSLAVTGLKLPDAPDGEIITLLATHELPTIVYTAHMDRSVHEKISSRYLIDYFLKDSSDSVKNVVTAIARLSRNRQSHILVVDDSISNRKALVHLLERQNYNVVEAARGDEALTILADRSDIELVITDYNMPDMDGHELTRRICDTYSPEKLRVIGISASTDPFLSASFLKAGAADFVYRPYVTEEVQCRVSNNIDTLSQIRRLRFLAERDPLSGLFNRRAFFERLEKDVNEMKQQQTGGAVGILDIDFFKKVNDTYGHDAGDLVIKGVADTIKSFCTGNNLTVARFGGEEFVFFARGITPEGAHELCEKMRIAIAEMAVEYDGAKIPVTASFGVARFHASEGIDNHLHAADQMLYMAKNDGRNRVVSDAMFD